MKRSILTLTTALMGVPLAFAACDDGPTEVDPAAASVSVYLTDAPGEVEAVWIEILSASLQGEEETVPVLDESTGLIEVTELVDRAQEIADDVSIPDGRYEKLSLIIGGAVLETTEGEVYTREGATHPDGLESTGQLHCPSCSQSGLKVQLHGVEITGGDNALVLDFDVHQSFGHQAGNSRRWIMRPVIHTDFDDDEDEALDGESIQGTVVLAEGVEIPSCPGEAARSLEDFIPSAMARTLVDEEGAPVVRTGEVDDEGEFEIDYVAPDVYDLGYLPGIDFDGATLLFEARVAPAEVTVTDQDVEGVRYTVTGARCMVGEG
jgi:hypothetical protein